MNLHNLNEAMYDELIVDVLIEHELLNEISAIKKIKAKVERTKRNVKDCANDPKGCAKKIKDKVTDSVFNMKAITGQVVEDIGSYVSKKIPDDGEPVSPEEFREAVRLALSSLVKGGVLAAPGGAVLNAVLDKLVGLVSKKLGVKIMSTKKDTKKILDSGKVKACKKEKVKIEKVCKTNNKKCEPKKVDYNRRCDPDLSLSPA